LGMGPKFGPTEMAEKSLGLWVMVFNATHNNISVILWQSVLLVEEKGETT